MWWGRFNQRQQVVVAVFGPSHWWSYHSADSQPTYGTRAFNVAGPVFWNALPDYLKSSDLSFDCFKHQLKHFYFVDTDTSTTVAH